MLPVEPDEPQSQPDIRISDADRNEMVEVLRQHCSEGRLTLDEFSDRVGEVFAARTRSELDKVMVDLPAPAPAPAPAPQGDAVSPAAATAPARRRPSRRWIVGIMSGGSAKGRWRPDDETNVLALMGGCEVDLRNAEIDGPEVFIRAWAIMGGIEIIVPEGIEVDMSGFALIGGNEKRVADVPRTPGSPTVHVKALSFLGGVSVKSRPPKGRGTRAVRQAVEERVQHTVDRALDRATRALENALGPIPPASPMPSTFPAPSTRLPQSVRAPGGTVTILFSDIEGFSSMTERLGDRKAQEIVRVHNGIVRGNVGACGGFEVKSQGDGFMIAFDSASKALRCAQAIQHELAAYTKTHPEEPVRVRMGLHTGEAIKDEDDFLGRTVIVASRIADAACGGEILVSALLKELVLGSGEFRFGEPREVELKGLSGTHQVVPVAWSS